MLIPEIPVLLPVPVYIPVDVCHEISGEDDGKGNKDKGGEGEGIKISGLPTLDGEIMVLSIGSVLWKVSDLIKGKAARW